MPFSFRDIVYGGAAPAVVAAVLFWVLFRFARRDVVRGSAAPVALSAGFLTGYVMLALGPLVPKTHWHYLPHVVLAAAVITPAIGLPRIGAVPRMILFAVAGTAATWLLVPASDDLRARTLQTVGWSVMAVLSAGSLDFALPRLNAAIASLLLSIVLASGAVVLGLAGSLRFAQMAGCGAAALGGIAAANWIRKEAQPVLSPIALPTALLMTGVMLIGRANSFSDVPLVSYLLVPLGAVALWPARTGLAAGRWRRGARWFLPVLVAAAAAIIALAVEGTGGDEW